MKKKEKIWNKHKAFWDQIHVLLNLKCFQIRLFYAKSCWKIEYVKIGDISNFERLPEPQLLQELSPLKLSES